ncbi:hypothetical protein ACOSQ2_015714 [Xanthoceras sorbifolium]
MISSHEFIFMHANVHADDDNNIHDCGFVPYYKPYESLEGDGDDDDDDDDGIDLAPAASMEGDDDGDDDDDDGGYDYAPAA